MAVPPLAIKLRCTSWEQLARMHERDLARGVLFLKSQKPPAVGTEIRIDVTIPSGTTITMLGRVAKHVTTGDRGPGVELVLGKVPASDMWVIESALVSAGFTIKSAAAAVARPAARPPVEKVPLPPPRSAPPGTVASARPPTEIPIEIDDAAQEPDAAAAELELVHALEAELTGLRGMNPFQVLNVGYEADDAMVRGAFNELTKKYHPDRFARYESETARALAGEIFILVREAYRRLGDPAARAGARAAVKGQPQSMFVRGAAPPPSRATPPAGTPALGRPATPLPLPVARAATPPPLAAPPQPSFEPEKVLSFRNTGPQPVVGSSSGAGKTPTPQRVPLPPAGVPIDLDHDALFGDLGEDPSGFNAGATPVTTTGASPFVARGEQLLEAGRYDEAFQAFDAAARSNPGDRSGRVGRELARGFQRLAEGDRLAAAQCFEAALEIDPMNERAARELAAMRRAATDARRGLLGKLLGKKT
jgi:tetratricopeptide (TPR) repeat protein